MENKKSNDGIFNELPVGTSWYSLCNCVDINLERVQYCSENPHDLYGISTGFRDLDLVTRGLEEGDLVVVAGRPSMLKTTLAMHICDHIASVEGLPVMYINLAAKTPSLSMRLLSRKSNISTDQIKSGAIADGDWECLADTVKILQESPLDFIEIQYPTIDKIVESARWFYERRGRVALIVIDYLQLINGKYEARYETRSSELSFITRQLKSLGQELQCPILAISQLNRAVESRVDRRPILSDLRDAGSIEDDADLVLLNYVDSFYHKDSREPDVLETIVVKNRHGLCGTIKSG